MPRPRGAGCFYSELLALQTLRRPPDWMVIGREVWLCGLRLIRLATTGSRPAGRSGVSAAAPSGHSPYLTERQSRRSYLPAGATRDTQDPHIWIDPAGHPFCLNEQSGSPRIRWSCWTARTTVARGASTPNSYRLKRPRGSQLDRDGDETPTPLGLPGSLGTKTNLPNPRTRNRWHLDIGIGDPQALGCRAPRCRSNFQRRRRLVRCTPIRPGIRSASVYCDNDERGLELVIVSVGPVARPTPTGENQRPVSPHCRPAADPVGSGMTATHQLSASRRGEGPSNGRDFGEVEPADGYLQPGAERFGPGEMGPDLRCVAGSASAVAVQNASASVPAPVCTGDVQFRGRSPQ